MLQNKVYAIGRDTYFRAYPNLGFGIKVGPRRLAISWRGGIEWFHKHPTRIWVRRRVFLSRVKRPGGV